MDFTMLFKNDENDSKGPDICSLQIKDFFEIL